VYSFNFIFFGISGFLGPVIIFVIENLGMTADHGTYPYFIVYLVGSFLAFVSIIVSIFTKENKFYYD
jgi:hypothetical protein